MKIFDRYGTEGVKIEDEGLRGYINLDEKLVLKSHGRHSHKPGKNKVNVIERMASLLSTPGHRGKKHKIQTGWASGKYNKNMKVILDTLEIIEKKSNKNPIQVLVKAIENSAPRDEVTTIEYGGAKYPQAVDVSPVRRVSLALRWLMRGGYDKCFNKKTKIEEGLAAEILKAAENSTDSVAVKKKIETEKQADAAR